MSAARKTVFVAGAGGAIGRVLCELLAGDGWRVIGTTRSPATAAELEATGIEPVLVDVFERDSLIAAVGAARPDAVVHQLTALPKAFDPAALAAARADNARVREVGTANLVAAAKQSGVKRLVAQSIAFAYAPGPRPFTEDAKLDVDAADTAARQTARAVATLEALVLGGAFEGVVLRYGRLYGPRTWFDVPAGHAPLHVDAAADAARRALSAGRPGVYNVAEDDGTVSSERARAEFGWEPGFRLQPRLRSR